jgi:DNA polymerase elongation subunit (family B)
VICCRNDWSLLCKNAANTVLKMGIQENNPDGAVRYLQDLCAKMRKHELPMSDFVISKQLHSLTPKTTSPHVALAQRLQATNPIDVPPLGSKVEYVIIKGYKDLSDASRRPEDVSVQDLDLDYYFEKQLLKPLTELVGPLVNGGEAKLRRLLVNENNNQKTMYQTFGVAEPLSKQKRSVSQKTVKKEQKKQKTMKSFFKK